MRPSVRFKRISVAGLFFILASAAAVRAEPSPPGPARRDVTGPANAMTAAEAREIVTRAYRDVLRRDPDPSGMGAFVHQLVDERKSEAWVRSAIAHSQEARDRARQRRRRALVIGVVMGTLCVAVAATFMLVRRLVNSAQLQALLADRALCRRLLLTNLALLLTGVFVVVGAFEWGMRRAHGNYDFFHVGRESPDFRQGREDIPRVFTPDPDLGFRPICGETGYYNAYGTQQNNYDIRKRSGVTRLLFIGDSVTAQGRVIGALKSLYGDKKFEYWNAGVESYSTVQEVGFYRKFNRPIQPDHVILTMVVNDMETTPLAFMSEGKLVMVAPNLPRSHVNPWLFRYSYIYRQFVSYRVSCNSREFERGIRDELIGSLASLRDELQSGRVKFTVLVLPLLAPPETYPEIAAKHRNFLRIVSGLNIRHFNLAAPVAAAIAALGQPDDKIHPTAGMARYLAGYLKDEGLFEE